METIGILVRINGGQKGHLVHPSRKGELEQDAIHLRIGIEAPDLLQNRRRGRPLRQVAPKTADADPSAGLLLVGHVDPAGRVVPHPENGQAWRAPGLGLCRFNHSGQSPFDGAGKLSSIQQGCHGEGRVQPQGCSPASLTAC